MHVLILLITVWYYTSTGRVPQTRAMIAPSAEACVTAGPAVKAKLEADKEVRLAEWVCLEVDGDKDKI